MQYRNNISHTLTPQILSISVNNYFEKTALIRKQRNDVIRSIQIILKR
jgi:hypothetical protein